LHWTLVGTGLLFFLVGYYLGREGVRRAEPERCPKCGHRRLYWCRGCGAHFDDGERVLSPREYERLTAVDALFQDGDRR
jgi:DNA-directed RNA polymerase subunit RPC12/RpoP